VLMKGGNYDDCRLLISMFVRHSFVRRPL
jgi:hypothetical protein